MRCPTHTLHCYAVSVARRSSTQPTWRSPCTTAVSTSTPAACPRTFYILKRPHLDTFLLTLAPYYHITVFTASIRRYADAVLDLVDTHNSVTQRLYRSHCVRDERGQLVKDLSAVGKGRKRVVLVDNSPFAYSRNEDNAIPISTWYDEQSDTELRSLIPLLLALRNVDDVRTVLGRRRMMLQSTA